MEVPMPTIHFQMTFLAETKQEGRYFIARTLPLDVYSQGPTEAKALENLVEALQLFIESCFERGVLDQVLKNCGFQMEHGAQLPVQTKDQHELKVPLSLVARNVAENRAH